MAKRGRKSKLTDELRDEICELLENGNFIETACDAVGISHQTFYRWLDENSELNEAIKRARSKAERKSIERIRKAAEGGDVASVQEVEKRYPDGTIEKERNVKYTNGQWQADAWFLERSFPARWGKRQEIKQEITGKDGSPLNPTSAPGVVVILPSNGRSANEPTPSKD